MGEMASAMMIGGEAAASGAGMMGAGAEGIGAAGTAGAAMGGANAAVGAGGGLLQGLPGMAEGGDGLMAVANLSGESAPVAAAQQATNPFFSAINTGIDAVANNTIQPVADAANAVGDLASRAGKAVGDFVGGSETLQKIGETAKGIDDTFLAGMGQKAIADGKEVLANAWNNVSDVVARKEDGSVDAWKTAGNAIYKGGKAALLKAMQNGNRPALTLDTKQERAKEFRTEAEDAEENLRRLRGNIG